MASVSVLLPSYQYADSLPECLESLARQTDVDWELIAVDDGSNDGSLEILKDFSGRFPDRVRVFTHPDRKNRGLAATLRLALSHSRSDLVAILEADDMLAAQSLSQRVSAMQRNPDVTVTHAAVEMFGDEDLVRQRRAQYRWKGFPSSKTTSRPYEAFPFLLKGNITLTFSSIMARRDALLFLDWDTPHEAWLDWWLLTQLAVRGRFYYEPLSTVCWRIHPKSYNARYNARLADRESAAQGFLASLRRVVGALLVDAGIPVGDERRAALEKILHREEYLDRSVWRRAKRVVKKVLKRILGLSRSENRYTLPMNLTRASKKIRHSFQRLHHSPASELKRTKKVLTPHKIAFLHIPKTAGTTVEFFLIRSLCQFRGYKHHQIPRTPKNEALDGVGYRNFSAEEMRKIAVDPAPLQFFRNHAPWPEEVFRELKRNGWYVFSFVRHPGDIVCSWYHFMKFGCGAEVEGTLEDCLKTFFSQPLDWMIPDYWSQIDYIHEFSETNVRGLIEDRLGLAYHRPPLTNISTNRGYEYYCRKGEISKETQHLIESHEQFRRYLAIKARSVLTQSSAECCDVSMTQSGRKGGS